MQKTRTYMAIMAIAASASLLAACSNEDDAATPVEPVPPAAAPGTTAPAPMSPTTPPASPGASSTPSSSPPSTMDRMEQDARATGDAAGKDATELKDDAAAAAERARQAVKDGAAEADRAIQDRLGNDNNRSTTTPPATTN